MPIGVILKSSNTGNAAKVRRAATRTKCSRVIVMASTETMIVMARKHSGRWLDEFCRNEKATIITRNAEIPAETYPAACGIEMLHPTSRKKHQSQCKRCNSILAPGDIRKEVKAQVTAEAAEGNAQNLYQTVTSYTYEPVVEALVEEINERLSEETTGPVAEPTLPVLIDEMRGIADKALNLASEVEAAVGALTRLGEIRQEMHGLVAEYERLKEEAARIK